MEMKTTGVLWEGRQYSCSYRTSREVSVLRNNNERNGRKGSEEGRKFLHLARRQANQCVFVSVREWAGSDGKRRQRSGGVDGHADRLQKRKCENATENALS